MPEQKHIIKRQILNIHLPQNVDAQPVQKEVLDIYNSKLIPIINQVCNELSPSGTKHKIEQLNIDLGKLKIADFENDFVQKFTTELQSQLREEVNAAPKEVVEKKPGGSPTDLFAYYIRTGVLPWWMEETTKAHLFKVLDGLNESPNELFNQMLVQICQNESYLERFVYTFSDKQICRTLRNVNPLPLENLIPALDELIEYTSAEAANYWWINVARQIKLVRNYEELEQNIVLETLKQLKANPNHILKRSSVKKGELFRIVGGLSAQDWAPTKSVEIIAIEKRLNELARKHSKNQIVLAFAHMVEQFIFPNIHQHGARSATLNERQIAAFEKELKLLDIPDELSILKSMYRPEMGVLEKQTGEKLKNILAHVNHLQSQMKSLKDSTSPQINKALDDVDGTSQFSSKKSLELIAIKKRLKQLAKQHASNPLVLKFVNEVEQLFKQALNTGHVVSRLTQHQIGSFLKELQQLKLPKNLSDSEGMKPPINQVLEEQTKGGLKQISKSLRQLQHETKQLANSTYRQISAIEKRLKEITQQSGNPFVLGFVRDVEQLIEQPVFAALDDRTIKTFLKKLQSLKLPENTDGLKSFQSTIKQKIEVLTKESLKHISITVEHLKKQAGHKDSPNQEVIERQYSTFDDSESISINNAGLVLFWPFLILFFENLELLEAKEFTSEKAQHRAAIVLQYLVAENASEIFEAVLPLNKVLCGIDLTDPVESVALDADEKEVINGLLQSVISKGSLWQNLSVEGFRKSYLKREGLLRTRDGKWLLQVKKETYDITLEKLPWSFSTIKLPWMNEMLVVEWM